MAGTIVGKNDCLVGENTNKGQCLVGENTNKGQMSCWCFHQQGLGGKYMARYIAEKKIIVCNETPREGLRRQLSAFGGDYSRKPDPRENVSEKQSGSEGKTPRGTPKEAIKNKKSPVTKRGF